MPDAERYRLHASLGYQLSIASRLQEGWLDAKLKPLGLTRIAWCILLAVENEGLFNPSEIARFVGIDRTATSRALRQMEGAGVVSRSAGTGDRRTTRVAATELGRALIARATPHALENARRMEAKLTPGELAELRRLLVRLCEGERIELAQL